MKNTIKPKFLSCFGIIVLAVMLASCASTGGGGSSSGEGLSGTYREVGTDVEITFSGNNFTIREGDNTLRGTYSASGSSFALINPRTSIEIPNVSGTGTGSINTRTSVFSAGRVNTGTWTIVDANTLLDPFGSLWEETSYFARTDRYRFQNYWGMTENTITFDESNFTLWHYDSTILRGTYSVTAYSIILDFLEEVRYGPNPEVRYGPNSGESINVSDYGTWTIVNANTIRARNGGEWYLDQSHQPNQILARQQAAAQQAELERLQTEAAETPMW